jgi:hypothetical protein
MPGASRTFGFATVLVLLASLLAFVLLAGRPNHGLIDWSGAARVIFGLGTAAGAGLTLLLLRRATEPPAGSPLRRVRYPMTALALSALWALSWFWFLDRVALHLDGPVARESARLARPLIHKQPLLCLMASKVRTESNLTGDVCMKTLLASSHWVPLLGCVDLDARATVEVRRTFLGAVVSLVEVRDVPRHCENKRREP